MKINVPGFPTRYVDEPTPESVEVIPPLAPTEVFPTAEQAMLLALDRARQAAAVQNGTQLIEHTKTAGVQLPLIDNATANIDPGVNPSAALEHGAGPVPTGTTPTPNDTQIEYPTAQAPVPPTEQPSDPAVLPTPKFDEVKAPAPVADALLR